MSGAAAAALLAIDWGSTSARAYRMGVDGAILAQRDAAIGVQQVRGGDYANALSVLLGDWSSLPVPRVACGMIGSRQGWVEAPYVPCPASLSALAGALVYTPERELAIVGGVSCRDNADVPDVMRGEETQIAGLPDAALESAVVVQPGTHSKWSAVERGSLLAFSTYMTGELFALLRDYSTIGRMMVPDAQFDAPAFKSGVARGLHPGVPGELLHRIFGARTLALFDELSPAAVADCLSGVLIGSEVVAGLAWARGRAERLWLVGAPALCMRYEIALRLAGHTVSVAPADAAACGLWRLATHAGLLLAKHSK